MAGLLKGYGLGIYGTTLLAGGTSIPAGGVSPLPYLLLQTCPGLGWWPGGPEKIPYMHMKGRSIEQAVSISREWWLPVFYLP